MTARSLDDFEVVGGSTTGVHEHDGHESDLSELLKLLNVKDVLTPT